MKLGVFVISGAMASVAGVLLALFVSGAYPEFGFWTTSGEVIFMLMLGGKQFFLGPVVGALLLRLIEHFVTIYTEHHGLVLGAVILFIVLGLRQGVGDYVSNWLAQRKEKRKGLPHREPETRGARCREGRLMLSIQNLDKSFGGVHATRNVSIDFPAGSLTAIIGPNGAGKTTFSI